MIHDTSQYTNMIHEHFINILQSIFHKLVNYSQNSLIIQEERINTQI